MITDPLREEHQSLLPQLRQLRDLADEIGDISPQACREGLQQALDFVNCQLLPHAEAEDRVLYPAVARLMGARLATRTMSCDHQAVYRMGIKLQALQAGLQESAPDAAALKAMRRLLYGLYAVVKLHLWKEETVYWPLLESRLDQGEMDELLQAMRTADDQAGLPARKTPPVAAA